MSGYGSVTATLEHSPGAALGLYVTYLTPAQLRRMNETEGGYHLMRLCNLRLHVGTSVADHVAGRPASMLLSEVLQYNHQKGTLWLPLDDPSPVALSELPCHGRQFPSLPQPEMQGVVMRLTGGLNNEGLAPDATSEYTHLLRLLGPDCYAMRLIYQKTHDIPSLGAHGTLFQVTNAFGAVGATGYPEPRPYSGAPEIGQSVSRNPRAVGCGCACCRFA